MFFFARALILVGVFSRLLILWCHLAQSLTQSLSPFAPLAPALPVVAVLRDATTVLRIVPAFVTAQVHGERGGGGV